MFATLPHLLDDLTGLFYPRICACCATALVRNENLICTRCRIELPRTHFHKDSDNEVARIFWGRVPVENATAYFYFHKGGLVQKIMHKLKYKGQKELGIELGKIMGHDLVNSSFSSIDVIVPVPLHISKKRKRGYNQSELISQGIAGAMKKELDTKTLIRCIANPTQTKKHRYDRWMNVEGIFELKNYKHLENKHILLVDDIITTGATLESCAATLLRIPGAKVSIAAVAMA